MYATKRLILFLGCGFLTASITDVQSQQRLTVTFDQWTLACQDGNKTCEVTTAQESADQSPVAAQITVSGFDKDPLRISIQVAPNVWIAGGVRLVTASKDDQINAGFRWCVPGRCLADADLKQDALIRLAKQPATLVFQDATQREQKIPISFKGLDAALDARPRKGTQTAASLGNPFDGSWSIEAECQAIPPNVAKTNWKTNSKIENGKLYAKFGDEGKPGSGKFEGVIDADGQIELSVNGLTGDSKYNSNNAPEKTPYTWRATGSFSGTTGIAKRIEGRFCTVSFAKNR